MKRLHHRLQLFEPTLFRLKPRYAVAFDRLAFYLDDAGIRPDEYYALLCDRINDESKSPISCYTGLLGTEFYNRLVEESRASRQVKFGGQAAGQSDQVLMIPTSAPVMAPDRLEQEWRKFAQLRAQYAHFSWERFWLFFAPVFSGIFLYTTAEYRENISEPLLHLSQIQREEWESVAKDIQFAGQVQEQVTRLRQRVGSLLCQIPTLPLPDSPNIRLLLPRFALSASRPGAPKVS